jgi:hypothetical protein
VTGSEESIGMTPAQAREIGELLIEGADWCDQKAKANVL